MWRGPAGSFLWSIDPSSKGSFLLCVNAGWWTASVLLGMWWPQLCMEQMGHETYCSRLINFISSLDLRDNNKLGCSAIVVMGGICKQCQKWILLFIIQRFIGNWLRPRVYHNPLAFLQSCLLRCQESDVEWSNMLIRHLFIITAAFNFWI